MGFTADRRVHLSAFGDSALWAVAMIGASAPLRLVDGACRRSDGKVVVVVRDLEHHLFVLPSARPSRGLPRLADASVLDR